MLKIAAWNVNSINMRQARVLAFLKRHEADILCLQELKCLDDKFPEAVFNDAGYHCAVYGQKTYNGVAILSRTAPTDVERGFNDGIEDSQARFISAKIGGVTAISAYIPNGQELGSPAFKYKIEWLGRLKYYLQTHVKPEVPLVLCGDFNVALDDRDVYDPSHWRGKILFSEPEKMAIRNLIEFGLTDTFRVHHSESGKFSWWDYRELGFPLNKGLRIDYVFASAPLAKVCRAASIDREERKGSKPSDHAPVLAEFDF